MMLSTRFLFAAAVAFIAVVTLTKVDAAIEPVRVLRVTDDLGGGISQYAETILWLDERGYTVELAGKCYSACTLFTIDPDTCVVEGAELWFHAPFERDKATGVIIHDDEATATITSFYPDPIQEWIAAMGGLPNEGWIVLEGQPLYDLVPLCDPGVPTS